MLAYKSEIVKAFTKMSKQIKLRKIAKEVEKCRICPRNKIGKPVFGEGNPNAKLVFIGEAPGKKEAETGRSFIGRSGQLLRKTIREVLKLDDLKDVYITSPVKYLPKHGTPTRQEIAHGRTHLEKQLEIINPKVIVLLGNVAAQALLFERSETKSRTSPRARIRSLGRRVKYTITKDHGKFIKRNNKTYLITYHPAAVLRFPQRFKTDFLQDFRKLRSMLQY